MSVDLGERRRNKKKIVDGRGSIHMPMLSSWRSRRRRQTWQQVGTFGDW
jgi:hypothetical protein